MERAKAFIQKCTDLIRDVGEPLSLREAGVTEVRMDEDLDKLVEIGMSDPNMYTTPCRCNEEDLRELFRKMWGGVGG